MKKSMEFIRFKREYDKGTLDSIDLHKDPYTQFSSWLKAAERENIIEPYAMQISTVSQTGIPSIRTVLLRGFDSKGFLFFTNYESRKGKELESCPQAAALFLWKELERQVVIEGGCEKLDPSLSDAYFFERSRESQIAAWASKQGRIIPSRDFLEEQFQLVESRYRGNKIPRPPQWGGYRLIPSRFEFWQGRKFRLHDRFEYSQEAGQWKISRLSP